MRVFIGIVSYSQLDWIHVQRVCQFIQRRFQRENTGRLTGVAVALNGDVYVAGAGGGVWRSTDSAHQQWTPVFDSQQTTAEGALAVVPVGDRTSDYTVYAGTGEPTINLDSYAGVGILASTDHGSTWQRVGGNELVGAAVFKIIADGDVLFAATSHGLYRKATTDSTWQKVLGGPDTNPGTPNAQVLYLTAEPRHGTIAYLPDVYGWDAKLLALLDHYQRPRRGS